MEEKIIKDLTGNREEHIAPKKPAEPKQAEQNAFKRPAVRLAQPAEQMQEHLSGKRSSGEEPARAEAPAEARPERRNDRGDRRDRYGRNDRRDRRDRGDRRDRREQTVLPVSEEASSAISPEETAHAVSVTVGDDRMTECSAEKDAERTENTRAEAKQAPAQAENLPPVEVIGVRFRGAGKTYYFGPNGIKFADGDHAIVETVRGVEYGEVVSGNHLVPASEVVPPLKNVSRKADEYDAIHDRENRELEQKAKPMFYEKVEKNKLDMQLVDVEYTFDNSKLCFYFTAEGRVDFRELVKDLAGVFRTRIELRQIGVRDEARLFGGLGICGRPFCCKQFLSDFAQVSIKMAKEQNLSLASAKISGSCGRLMCCLRYEQDTYERENAELPQRDTEIVTPKGLGVVLDASFLTRKVKVRMADDNSIRTYTLEELEAAKEGRPLPKSTPEENFREEPTATESESSAPTEKQERRPRNNDRRNRNRGRNGENRNENRNENRGENRPASEEPKPEARSSEAPADGQNAEKNAEGKPHRGDRHRNHHGNRHGGRSGQNGQGGQNGQNRQG